MSDKELDGVVRGELRPANLRAVRLGHGANCSSIGSVVDTLFVAAVVGGAVFAAVLAAMKKEAVTVVGGTEPNATEVRATGASVPGREADGDTK